jgi:signal transduction histidine kinase
MKSANAVMLHDSRELAEAFTRFISASTVLENSYRELQKKVKHLSGELADRNAALTSSLVENDRMRATLQQMIDSMPCGVVVLDAADTVVMINPEGRRLLVLGAAQVKTLRELSYAGVVDFEGLTKLGPGAQDNELCVQTEGGKRWLAVIRREFDYAPREHEPAPPRLRTIWTLRDITSNKLAEQEREAARRAVTLSEISSILAHEIRNPLASLELFAGLIAEDGCANPQWIAHLRAGIRTLAGTVNNVLSLNGEANRRFETLDLVACVRDGVEFVKPIAEQANVTLLFHTGLANLTARGNCDGIRQIILNLICNAIRHTTAGGNVDVALSKDDSSETGSAKVEVKDTGCGISAGQMERLFEAGFSGSGETPGLGLAVCKRLMEQHGGSIHVSSCLNRGSSFVLEFPTI